jgi:hypothetical protein
MAAPSLRFVECVEGTDIVNYSLLLAEPVRAINGLVKPSNRPGFGCNFDLSALKFHLEAGELVEGEWAA